MALSSAFITCRNINYRYPTTGALALQSLSFSIKAGEYVLLAGASGSGKSTLCRLLNGLIPQLHGGEISGELSVANCDPRHTPPHQISQTVGFLLQQPDAQCLGTTVARDLAFSLACQGLDRRSISRQVDEIVAQLEIEHLLERAPHTLSGGEQQQVALGGVLVMQPRLLILDEPFAFLDAINTERLAKILRTLSKTGITLIITEHRLNKIVADASRMLVLNQGHLVADGMPGKVLAETDIAAWGLERPKPLAAISATSLPPSSSKPVMEWDHIWCKREGRAVLRAASLNSTAGEIVALLGANGAGKSTLLRHGNGLLRSQRGTVRVLGRPVAQRPVAKLAREVGLVIQKSTRMLFAPTVHAELTAGPRALQCYDPAWCQQLITRFSLGALLDRSPQTLSAGEQRRVAIAAVLASRPKVLLLDEPTAGQDACARSALHTALKESAAEGISVIIATHDLSWAYSLCQRWAVMTEGQIAIDAHPDAVLTQYQLLQHAGLATP
ncbi:MAG: hypothetical protein CSA09_00180 [Candidatus Contendobacter odensis]|uniref:ABC transporter domain-containing protein n=1 Tax=Candidatus Contendibacter odensensis TaxID=1400860 RepID=A0A2G6PGL4_9GAMM|nr:MAG: hypothetical protein CSA09_00180 [Candidatus Contendobacter odensis]